MCALGKHPIDKALFYKTNKGFLFCRRAGLLVNEDVRIEPWAVIYTKGANTQKSAWVPVVGPVETCREEIVSVYRRSNVVPMLYYRTPKFVPFDCSKIPLEKVMAWGPGRKRFTTLIKRMEAGIKRMRTYDCPDDGVGPPPKSQFSRKEVDQLLNRERIITAALTYINGAAFNSYLCV